MLFIFLEYGELHGEGGSFSEFALALDLALVEVDDLLDIGET